MLLGAGRKTKDDIIDMSAGIVLNAKIGHSPEDNPQITMYSSNHDLFEESEKTILSAFEFSSEKPPIKNIVIDVIK
jgi:thymidine phosphorylase